MPLKILLSTAGQLGPFARGSGGYTTAMGTEPYIAMPAGGRVTGLGCSFGKDAIYALEPNGSPGVISIDKRGKARRFASLPAGRPDGIAFDDVGRFGARYAYTLDGPLVGDLEIENFSADAMAIVFKGFSAHPGYAKGRMVSAVKLAAEFVHRLPRHGLSPETTDGYDGYVHPHAIQGGVERATVRMLLRDFNTKGLDEKAKMLTDLAMESCIIFAKPKA